MNFKPNKLLRAGVKAGGAVACGFGAWVALMLTESPGVGDKGLAIGVGLAASSAILGTQSINDAIGAFQADKDQE